MVRSSFSLKLNAVKFFFDAAEVVDRLDKAEARELSRIGSFIRRRARSILRRRKRASKSGEAPSVHSRDRIATLKFILFAYNPAEHSVIAGPVGLNKRVGGMTVPELLEFGGTVTVIQERSKNRKSVWIAYHGPRGGVGIKNRKTGEIRYNQTLKNLADGQWFTKSPGRKRPWKEYRSQILRYEPRPFMEPALAAEKRAGTITDTWRDSLGRAA